MFKNKLVIVETENGNLGIYNNEPGNKKTQRLFKKIDQAIKEFIKEEKKCNIHSEIIKKKL